MFKVDKESLLHLNDAMRNTIENMNYDNPVEVGAFASSMVSIGNQINMHLLKKQLGKEGDD